MLFFFGGTPDLWAWGLSSAKSPAFLNSWKTPSQAFLVNDIDVRIGPGAGTGAGGQVEEAKGEF